MINVQDICSPKEGWVDTDEQAALREVLVSLLDGRDQIDQINVGRDLIEFMRDQGMRVVSDLRKAAALSARDELGLSASDIVSKSGLSLPTVNRLLTRHRAKLIEVEAA